MSEADPRPLKATPAYFAPLRSHLSPAEHYALAELLIEETARLEIRRSPNAVARILGAAQVHALLALASEATATAAGEVVVELMKPTATDTENTHQ